VLGASGDLAKKKTFPSLFGLYRNGFLPKETRIIGYARTKMDRDEFVKRATEHIKLGESPDAKKKLEDFLNLTSYHNGQYNEDSSWEDLARYVEKVEGSTKQKNRLFYVALPPSVFLDVATGVRKHVYSDGFVNRIVIEKPFGKDLESSRELGTNISKLFKEEEVSYSPICDIFSG
jgi:glucose-6-phosphate 1-dehydrogenase